MSPLDLPELIHIIFTFLDPSTHNNVLNFAAVSSTFRKVVKSCTEVDTTFHCKMKVPEFEIREREDFQSDRDYKLHHYQQRMVKPNEYRKELEDCGELLRLFRRYIFIHCRLNESMVRELFESPILKSLKFEKSDFDPLYIPEKTNYLKELEIKGISMIEYKWTILHQRLPNLEGLKVSSFSSEILKMNQLKSISIRCSSVDNNILNQLLQTPFENLEKLEVVSYHINEVEMFNLPKLKELNLVHDMYAHRQHKMDQSSVRNILTSTRDHLEKLTLCFGMDETVFYEISPSSKLKCLVIEKYSPEFQTKFTNSTNIKLVTFSYYSL